MTRDQKIGAGLAFLLGMIALAFRGGGGRKGGGGGGNPFAGFGGHKGDESDAKDPDSPAGGTGSTPRRPTLPDDRRGWWGHPPDGGTPAQEPPVVDVIFDPSLTPEKREQIEREIEEWNRMRRQQREGR